MNAPHAMRTSTCAVLLGALAFSCASTDEGTPGLAEFMGDTEPPDLEQARESVEPLETADIMESMEPMAPMLPRLTGDGVFYVVGDDPQHPLARYSDGQLSLSNTCGIKTENKLNRRIPPIYVNGQPIGFC